MKNGEFRGKDRATLHGAIARSKKTEEGQKAVGSRQKAVGSRRKAVGSGLPPRSAERLAFPFVVKISSRGYASGDRSQQAEGRKPEGPRLIAVLQFGKVWFIEPRRSSLASLIRGAASNGVRCPGEARLTALRSGGAAGLAERGR